MTVDNRQQWRAIPETKKVSEISPVTTVLPASRAFPGPSMGGEHSTEPSTLPPSGNYSEGLRCPRRLESKGPSTRKVAGTQIRSPETDKGYPCSIPPGADQHLSKKTSQGKRKHHQERSDFLVATSTQGRE